jgi:hypothetical protein
MFKLHREVKKSFFFIFSFFLMIQREEKKRKMVFNMLALGPFEFMTFKKSVNQEGGWREVKKSIIKLLRFVFTLKLFKS